jgi:hypothetical protein
MARHVPQTIETKKNPAPRQRGRVLANPSQRPEPMRGAGEGATAQAVAAGFLAAVRAVAEAC